MAIGVAIVGASGRMGQLVTRLVEQSSDFEVVAAIGSTGNLDDALQADVLVDVTVPAVSQSIVDFAVDHGLNVLVGTSGWTGDRLAALTHHVERRNAEHPDSSVGVIVIPNFSVGSVLATSFATMAARFYDSVEIIEAHHATKVDSPSGTATRTAELIVAARGIRGPVKAPHADQRARGQQVASVPIHSLRLEGVVAKQEVIFGGNGEVLTVTHETISPTSYEAGIMLSLRALADTTGVVVGLDKLIDLTPHLQPIPPQAPVGD